MKYLLICDLDDTLTGDNKGILKFNKTMSSNRGKFYLIYSSGRFKKSIMSLIEREKLISPDAIISNVGTEIYYPPDWNIDQKWEKIINKNWTNTKKCMLSLLDEFDLRPQPYEKRFVMPYYVENETIVKEIKKTSGGLKVKIIWTKRQYLDIIPENAGKGNAVEFIGNKIDLPTVCCGDSENDVDMLEMSKYGILVGNASTNLKTELANRSGIYIAKSCYANGVIEGLKFYNII